MNKEIIKKLLEISNSPKLPLEDIKKLCLNAKAFFSKLPNVVEIKSPCIVVGDLHGQEVDLLHIFQTKGVPSKDNRYCFLGDYLNRSKNALRIILLIIAYSLELGENFVALRGNHETLIISQIYGFSDELKDIYGEKEGLIILKEIMNVCKCFPLAAIIGGKYFAVHAGISEHLLKAKDLNNIERKYIDLIKGDKEVDIKHKFERSTLSKDEQLLQDVLWSDPNEEKGSKGYSTSKRGAGKLFGEEETVKFCKENGFLCIIRSHQMVMEGFRFVHDKKCLTIFSASNYCGRCANLGAIVEVNEKFELKTTTYNVNISPTKKIFDLQTSVTKKIVEKKDVDYDKALRMLEMHEKELEKEYNDMKKCVESFRKSLIEEKGKKK